MTMIDDRLKGMTDEQLDAIGDAGEREGWESKSPAEILELLEGEKHPLFLKVAGDPFEVGGTEADRDVKPDNVQAPAESGDYSDYDDGLDEQVDKDDLETPRFKLKQEQTELEDGWADKIENGMWFRADDPSVHGKKRSFVFVALAKHRRLMPKYKDPEGSKALRGRIQQLHAVVVPPDHKGPYCLSDDKVAPRDQGFGVLNKGACEGCQHAEWRKVGEGAEAKRVMDCGEVYTWLVYDVTNGLPGSPGLLDFSGGSYREGKKLLTRLRARKVARKLPVFGFKVELSSIKKSGAKHYSPVIGKPEAMEKGELDELLPLYFRECKAFQGNA